MRGAIVFVLLLLLPAVDAHVISRNSGDYGSLLVMEYDPALEGVSSYIAFYLTNLSSGEPLDLDTAHERKMHIFIVGEDLQTFVHTHPEDYAEGFAHAENGRYEVTHVFPHAGNYLIAIDYAVEGRQVFHTFIEPAIGVDPLPEPKIDYARSKSFGSYAVTLSAPGRIRINESIDFAYHIEKDGLPVHNLQQYLGSEMHVFIVNKNLTFADHTHAYVPGHGIHVGSMPQRYVGPNIPVRYAFDAPGTYVLFGQFQHEGRVVTTQFMLEVEPAYEFPWNVVLIPLGVLLLIFLGWSIYKTNSR
jgi:hypothetical protein